MGGERGGRGGGRRQKTLHAMLKRSLFKEKTKNSKQTETRRGGKGEREEGRPFFQRGFVNVRGASKGSNEERRHREAAGEKEKSGVGKG